MNPAWVEISKLLGAGLSSVGMWQLLTGLLKRRQVRADASKSEADAVQVVSAAAASLVVPLRETIEGLQRDVAEAKRHAKGLDEQLHAANVELARLRATLDATTKDLLAAHEELARIKGEPWRPTP